MSTLVSGRAVNFCPWVALQNSRCMPTSTTTTQNSSSLAHSCSGPTPSCPAVTRAYTATTFFLKAQKDLLACGSTVMCVSLLIHLCGCRQHYSRLHVSSFIQSSFNNPEWFYRHVDNHVESAEQQSFAQQQQALFCQWSGMTEPTF